MTEIEYARTVRQLSATVVAEVGRIRGEIEEKLTPEMRPNFVQNVLVAAAALAIELMIEELKGEHELAPDADEKVLKFKMKLADTVKDILVEEAGDKFITLQKRVEIGEEEGEPDGADTRPAP
jgi:hypothetical protein